MTILWLSFHCINTGVTIVEIGPFSVHNICPCQNTIAFSVSTALKQRRLLFMIPLPPSLSLFSRSCQDCPLSIEASAHSQHRKCYHTTGGRADTTWGPSCQGRASQTQASLAGCPHPLGGPLCLPVSHVAYDDHTHCADSTRPMNSLRTTIE